MIVVTRFQDPGPGFESEAKRVIAWWARCQGCRALDLVRNLDDPDLWAIVGRWDCVGDYRRSFNGYDAKVILMPLLSLAVDEPTAYLPAEEVGHNFPRTNY